MGQKKSAGATPVDLAGLTGGSLFGITVVGFPSEAGIPATATCTAHGFGDVSATSGAMLQTLSRANGVTEFARPEDGAWDPNDPRDFYFVTTASFASTSRLWRLRFTDPAQPALGGTIDMLLDGTEGQKMMDNLTVTDRGQVFIQEDPGNQSYLARIWRYDIATDALVEVAHHDADRFVSGGSDLRTQDEESSGSIDVSHILGEGKFLIDVQVRASSGDVETVE